jgi:hypothetical protein
VCLVLVSCGKNKEDEKLFEEMNLALESSNKQLEHQSKDHFDKLEDDYKNLRTKDNIAVWLPKAKLVAQLSNDLLLYINSLRENKNEQ